ncbi:MAG: NHLP bacteriocin export ABC transporter permease/ATPase subunit [Cyanobacteria bacterium P01_F01_bin.53]
MVFTQSLQTNRLASDGTLPLGGNEVLRLDDPARLWQVKSGSVGIFGVAWVAGEPTGPRHYLFTVDADAVMLGASPENGFGLIAIAFEPTALIPIDWKSSCQSSQPLFHQNAGNQSDDIPKLFSRLSDWLNQFGQIQSFPTLDTLPVESNAQYYSLRSDDCYGLNDALTWVKIKNGSAAWLGHDKMPIVPDTGLFPLGVRTWLKADTATQLQSYPPDELLLDDVSLQAVNVGISHFYQYCFKTIEQIVAGKQQVDQQQFEQRQQLNQETTQHALQGLASLLKPVDDSYLSAETPLLVAAGAVGHVLGVTIAPPNRSENLEQVKEPLEAIARASQLRLRQVLLRGQWWRQDSGPMVVYTREDREPMALLPIKNSRYELLNPVTLKRALVDESVASQLEPTAHVFYRPLPNGKLNAWTLLQFAFHGRQRDLWMILCTGVITSLLGMAIPQATAVLIDNAIPYGSKGILLQIGLALLAVAFGRACFQFAQAIAAMRIETASDATLQAAVWDRLLKLHTSFFRDYSTGDLQSRVSSITAIRRKLSGTALDAILSGAFALLNLGLLFYYSTKLAILALFVAFLVVSVTVISGAILLKKQRPLLELDGELYGLMVQLINGVSKLRIAGAEPRAFAQWGEKYRQQLSLDLSTQRLEDSVSVFNTAMPTITVIALFGIASTLVDPNNDIGLTTGTFLAFNAAFAIFISGATNLSLTLIDVLEVIPLWMRSQPILTAEPEVDTQKGDPGQLTGRICLDRVTFRYREDGPLILDDVTIDAHPGEFIALVGPSGSGKSTVLRLLLGFETPQTGTVYFDNQDVMGIDISAVRRQLGVVLQNGRINAGSIFENVSGGALITLDDAWRAAEMAGFADDVRSFPMQMHTVISEGGGNLSGGQRQRLVIARALALNPKILLLDEATSALDNRTQAIVSESLDQLNVTRIVVAHRLSTIRNADRIYVIKAGRVVQQGSFDELAAQEGVFAQLIKRQMA